LGNKNDNIQLKGGTYLLTYDYLWENKESRNCTSSEVALTVLHISTDSRMPLFGRIKFNISKNLYETIGPDIKNDIILFLEVTELDKKNVIAHAFFRKILLCDNFKVCKKKISKTINTYRDNEY